MSTYTEDHLVEQPAVQLMRDELGWQVVNCYDEWSGGVSNQGRDGKREGEGNIEHRTPNIERRSEEKRKIRLNPDLPVEASEGAEEGRENMEHRTSNIEHRSEEMRKTLAELKGETEKHFKLAWAPLEPLALAIHRFPK